MSYEMDWNLLGFVKASQYRQKILISLEKGNKTPKEIKDEVGYYLSHVSSTLTDLKEKELVVCLTPELFRGKIYSLTELGHSITKELNK